MSACLDTLHRAGDPVGAAEAAAADAKARAAASRVPPVAPIADWLITANTKQHTVSGCTSWHMVAAAHEATIRHLVHQLHTINGANAIPAADCEIVETNIGPASVRVEVECEPASGDGHDEPRHEADFAASRVLINGMWVQIDTAIDALRKMDETLAAMRGAA